MSSEPEPRGADTEWDAYSDYQHVSRRVAGSIGDAIDAISVIDSGKVAGEKLSSREETDLRADVLGAVIRLQTELENERDQNEVYDEILARWEGDEGYINRFRGVDPMDYQAEAWLQQFARDIHRAGWELGYLKAGREEKQNRGGDAYDGEVRDMIEEMTI
ncbi:MAG: hypothetical protein HQRvContig02_20 [Haloquadratum phage sp.]|nr:MAG: hypothetical protein HQRvContig02_20 [Haloquadratum phage sp.]